MIIAGLVIKEKSFFLLRWSCTAAFIFSFEWTSMFRWVFEPELDIFPLCFEKFMLPPPLMGLCVIDRLLFSERAAEGTLKPGNSVCRNFKLRISRSTMPIAPYYSEKSKTFKKVPCLGEVPPCSIFYSEMSTPTMTTYKYFLMYLLIKYCTVSFLNKSDLNSVS